MSRIIEEMKKEAMAEKSMEIAIKLLEDGISIEKTASYTELSVSEVEALCLEMQSKENALNNDITLINKHT